MHTPFKLIIAAFPRLCPSVDLLMDDSYYYFFFFGTVLVSACPCHDDVSEGRIKRTICFKSYISPEMKLA